MIPASSNFVRYLPNWASSSHDARTGSDIFDTQRFRKRRRRDRHTKRTKNHTKESLPSRRPSLSFTNYLQTERRIEVRESEDIFLAPKFGSSLICNIFSGKQTAMARNAPPGIKRTIKKNSQCTQVGNNVAVLVLLLAFWFFIDSL